jgi:hypothetical protein
MKPEYPGTRGAMRGRSRAPLIAVVVAAAAAIAGFVLPGARE